MNRFLDGGTGLLKWAAMLTWAGVILVAAVDGGPDWEVTLSFNHFHEGVIELALLFGAFAVATWRLFWCKLPRWFRIR